MSLFASAGSPVTVYRAWRSVCYPARSTMHTVAERDCWLINELIHLAYTSWTSHSLQHPVFRWWLLMARSCQFDICVHALLTARNGCQINHLTTVCLRCDNGEDWQKRARKMACYSQREIWGACTLSLLNKQWLLSDFSHRRLLFLRSANGKGHPLTVLKPRPGRVLSIHLHDALSVERVLLRNPPGVQTNGLFSLTRCLHISLETPWRKGSLDREQKGNFQVAANMFP